MNRIRIWTFGGLVGLLAIGDWLVATAPAGDEVRPRRTVSVGNVDVSAVMREVECEGKMERHAFLVLAGEGTGTVKVRLQKTTSSMESRVAPMPELVWEKEFPLDTAVAREVALGFIEASQEKPTIQNAFGDRTTWEILASADGTTFIPLFNPWDEFSTALNGENPNAIANPD